MVARKPVEPRFENTGKGGKAVYIGKELIGLIKQQKGRFRASPASAYKSKPMVWDSWDEAVTHILLCWTQGVVNPHVTTVSYGGKWSKKGVDGWNGS